MLREIQCDKFISKGKIRPAIKFHSGLNTVLGGANANNSIGKTTFLLIVDFVFGGNTYLNSDALHKVGSHTINFMFEFDNEYHYFSRNTTKSDEINICDENYRVRDTISLDEFNKFLQVSYDLDLYKSTFRNLVGRYFRIYGKDNYDETKPLQGFKKESNADAILSIEKLFEVYEIIEEYKENLKAITDELKALNSTRKYDFLPYGKITTKTQYKNNEKNIALLYKELDALNKGETDKYFELDREEAEKAGIIDGELSSLTRKRSRLVSQLNVVKANMKGGQSINMKRFGELSNFFPDTNIKKLAEIESFHVKIREILKEEYQEEAERLQILIDSINSKIEHLKEELNKHGVPAGIPRGYLKKYTEIQKNIEKYEAQNKNFDLLKELRDSKKSAAEKLEQVEAKQLRTVESTINEQMVRFNDSIYETKRKAPVLDLNGGKTYEFYTPDDSGTGTSFKSLIIFDLSVLMHTKLPALAHDSLLFKNIGDEPVEKIIKLYTTFEKQIFIAFDKDTAYSDEAKEILNKSTVIRLDENGNELFGRSWNIKD